MTFRQILAVLWRRRWIIVIVTVIAAGVAVIYVQRMTPNYVSNATVRLSPIISQSVSTGQLGGVAVDVDPTLITSATILDPAAVALDSPAGSLVGAVTASQVAATTTGGSVSIEIAATAPTAEAAKARAEAVVKSFSAYLDSVVSSTVETLQKNLATATSQAVANQSQVAADPKDSIAASNLASALSTMSALNSQISTLQGSGATMSVTKAAPVGVSTNPSPWTVFAIALVCGLIAGVGIALIRDHFDERLREDDDIEALAMVPVLAVLANDRRVARRKERLPAASPARTALSEGIRSLRTSAQVLLPEGKGTIVLTSVEPGDGKTFISSNLALSWARAGRKVVLVGGDMRRPQLREYFDHEDDGEGLADLLLEAAEGKRPPTQARIAEALQATKYRGLRVLPPGSEAEEPADLLAGPGLERVMRFLARAADLVVIDTPPAFALADASELAAHADGTIIVVTVGRTRREMIAETAESLRANGANVIGVVVNRSRRRLPKSYASYYINGHPKRGPIVPALSAPHPSERLSDDELDALADDELPSRTTERVDGDLRTRRNGGLRGWADAPVSVDPAELGGSSSQYEATTGSDAAESMSLTDNSHVGEVEAGAATGAEGDRPISDPT